VAQDPARLDNVPMVVLIEREKELLARVDPYE